MPVVVVRSKGWEIKFVDDLMVTVNEHGYDNKDELEGICLMQERLILVDSSLERAHRIEIFHGSCDGVGSRHLIHAISPVFAERIKFSPGLFVLR